MSTPLRIGFCTTTLEVGGTERALVELVTRLSGCDVEPRVFVLGAEPHDARGSLLARLQAAEVPVGFGEAQSSWQTPCTLARLTRWLRNFAPEVLQCFLYHANVLGAVAARRSGVPHVVTGIRVAERRRNLHRWLARRTDPLVSRHVCVSHDVAAFAAEAMGLPADKLVVIPNGVDLPAHVGATSQPPALLRRAPGRRWLTFIGRLDPQKRLDWLLRRMPQIAQRLPQHDLLIVGQGPEERRLRRLGEQLALGERLVWAGWQADVPALLAASDVLLLTSASEGMPNVVLEAMAAGKPVVATAVEGVAEALGEGAFGQVVGRDDSQAFVQAVQHFATDAEAASAAGAANRRRAEQLTWAAAAAAYLRLYLELTGRPTADSG